MDQLLTVLFFVVVAVVIAVVEAAKKKGKAPGRPPIVPGRPPAAPPQQGGGLFPAQPGPGPAPPASPGGPRTLASDLQALFQQRQPPPPAPAPPRPAPAPAAPRPVGGDVGSGAVGRLTSRHLEPGVAEAVQRDIKDHVSGDIVDHVRTHLGGGPPSAETETDTDAYGDDEAYGLPASTLGWAGAVKVNVSRASLRQAVILAEILRPRADMPGDRGF